MHAGMRVAVERSDVGGGPGDVPVGGRFGLVRTERCVVAATGRIFYLRIHVDENTVSLRAHRRRDDWQLWQQILCKLCIRYKYN